MSIDGLKPRQTRLSFQIRRLCEKCEDPIISIPAEQAAANLDKAAVVMGVKGDRVKTLGAYAAALIHYQRLSGGRPYAG